MSNFTDKLVAACNTEYATFKFGKLKENSDAVYQRVGDYWKSIPVNGIDGKTLVKPKKGKPYNPAWSSAFISFVVKSAGAGKAFKYAEAHCHYVEDARLAAKSGAPRAYYAVDPYSAIPAVGDLICAGREYAEDYSFEQSELAYKTDTFYPSHSDVVIEVNRDHGYILTLGGNVDNSVTQKRLAISSKGILLDRPNGNKMLPWLALLQCKL